MLIKEFIFNWKHSAIYVLIIKKKLHTVTNVQITDGFNIIIQGPSQLYAERIVNTNESCYKQAYTFSKTYLGMLKSAIDGMHTGKSCPFF